MKIKSGYGKKELEIEVVGVEMGYVKSVAEMWIRFGCSPKTETLSFLDLNELVELKKEIQKAIEVMVKC
jgi:hypothetical protein